MPTRIYVYDTLVDLTRQAEAFLSNRSVPFTTQAESSRAEWMWRCPLGCMFILLSLFPKSDSVLVRNLVLDCFHGRVHHFLRGLVEAEGTQICGRRETPGRHIGGRINATIGHRYSDILGRPRDCQWIQSRNCNTQCLAVCSSMNSKQILSGAIAGLDAQRVVYTTYYGCVWPHSGMRLG